MTWLCPASEVGTEKPHRVKLDGREYIVLKSASGDFFVSENMCSHARVPLHTAEWNSQTGVLTCAAHKAQFDMRKGGKPLCPPAVSPVNLHPCELRARPEEGGALWVSVQLDLED